MSDSRDQSDWDMIDVLGLELLHSNTIGDILFVTGEKLVIAPAGMSRQATADRVSRWWARRPA